MDKCRSSRSNRYPIDNTVSTDYSQHGDDSQLMNKNQPECQNRNNHNSSSIHHDNVIKTTSKIALRKRRIIVPYNPQVLLSPSLLIFIRLIILFIISLIFYYILVYIYSKPKQSGWKHVFDTTIDWLNE